MSVVNSNTVSSENARHFINDGSAGSFDAESCKNRVDIVGGEPVKVDKLISEGPHASEIRALSDE